MQRVVTFLKEVRAEIGRVVWPSRQETIRATAAVLLVTAGVAIFAAFWDYVFSGMLNFLVQK